MSTEAPVTLNPGVGGDTVRAEQTANGKQQVVTLADGSTGGLAQVTAAGALRTDGWDQRSLTERMIARAPATGYHLWLDVTSSSAMYIYLAEAPDGSASSATVFRGTRLTLDASGNPLGAVQTASGFSWDARSTAAWGS